MNCDDVQRILDEEPAAAVERSDDVSRHVASCASCASYATFLVSLREGTAALPRERRPERDLWPGIAARLSRPKVVRFDARGSRVRVATFWAVAAAAVLAATTTYLWTRGSTAPRQYAAPSVALAPHATTQSMPASYEAGEAEFARATTDLLTVLESRKDSLSPVTRKTVERNLQAIDQALSEIKDALAKDPGSHELLRLLSSTRRRKIEALQRVVKLSV